MSAVIGDERLDTGFHVTTPDAHDMQEYMARMLDAGLTHAVLETTSHGWAQHRVDACEFDIGAVTNITHEHLDEHGTYENYRAAKARLIESLATTPAKPGGNPRLAVLNADDSSYSFLRSIARTPVVSYGLGAGADVVARDVHEHETGTSFVVDGGAFRLSVESPLRGAFNVSNCLAAICATIIGARVPVEMVPDAIRCAAPVPGRLETVNVGQEFLAIVDFAHTPNALREALLAGRQMLRVQSKPGRLIAVFGSAGLRDRAKRPMMAETSVELADLTVLTAEDPRTESLDVILSGMAEGAASRGGVEGKTFWRIPDRGEALRMAVRMAQPGDLVMACGKGHEQSMCFGRTEYAWDDRFALRSALCELLGIAGPEMPYLPTRDQTEAQWLQTG